MSKQTKMINHYSLAQWKPYIRVFCYLNEWRLSPEESDIESGDVIQSDERHRKDIPNESIEHCLMHQMGGQTHQEEKCVDPTKECIAENGNRE